MRGFRRWLPSWFDAERWAAGAGDCPVRELIGEIRKGNYSRDSKTARSSGVFYTFVATGFEDCGTNFLSARRGASQDCKSARSSGVFYTFAAPGFEDCGTNFLSARRGPSRVTLPCAPRAPGPDL